MKEINDNCNNKIFTYEDAKQIVTRINIRQSGLNLTHGWVRYTRSQPVNEPQPEIGCSVIKVCGLRVCQGRVERERER